VLWANPACGRYQGPKHLIVILNCQPRPFKHHGMAGKLSRLAAKSRTQVSHEAVCTAADSGRVCAVISLWIVTTIVQVLRKLDRVAVRLCCCCCCCCCALS
jgi:hypothetical protein